MEDEETDEWTEHDEDEDDTEGEEDIETESEDEAVEEKREDVDAESEMIDETDLWANIMREFKARGIKGLTAAEEMGQQLRQLIRVT